VGLLGGALLLEALPVAAWLQTLAAYTVRDPSQAALPLWYLLVTLAVAAGVGRVIGRRGVAAMLRASAPLWALGALVGWRISPAGYAALPGGLLDLSWLGALGSDVVTGAPRLASLLGLLLLGAYLWWRGLRAGAGGFHVEGVLATLRGSLIAVIMAVAVAAGVPRAARMAVDGRLAALLPLDVFAGLVAVALARAGERAEAPQAWPSAGQAEDRPWLSLALGLASTVVGVALVVGLALAYGGFPALLRALRPVGDGIYTVLGWLLAGYVFLISVLFGWLPALISALRSKRPATKLPTPPSAPPCMPSRFIPRCAPPRPDETFLAVLAAVVALAVVVALLYLLYRLLRALLSRRDEAVPDAWEERESLDGRALLGAQMRALLDRLRRGATGAHEEALPPGSVRRVYRDLLRVAGAAGVGRLPDETPDEYARRLAGAVAVGAGPPGAGSDNAEDVARVTQAYDRVRYGEVEPGPDQLRDVRARAERLIARLRRR
jgi:hypothetical protein